MAGLQDSHKKDTKKYSSEQQSSESFILPTYHGDKDFDEAFKNLLRPIESISKRNQCEPLQYDLLKELDSYLNHLRENSDGDSSVFVEAALMFQNVVLIYQKRADQLIDVLIKLIAKFRAYRLNLKENNNNDTEDVEGNKNKKKEKKIKFYHAFEPIKGQVFGTLKNFDCKVVNLSKKQALSKIVLNANIKVENKYNQIMPYICIGNGENIGKKYDFMIINPLNRDLAVNEEFDCPTKEDKKNLTPLNSLKNTDPLPTNVMDVDEVDSNDVLPSTPDPVIFDQTVINDDEMRVQQAMTPVNVMNISKIPPMTDVEIWPAITSTKDDMYTDKPMVDKKVNKNDDDVSNGGVWLPTYTIGELQCQLIKLKSGLTVDPMFMKLVYKAQEVQRSELLKLRNKRIIEKEKELFGYHDEELERRLKNGEEPGFKGFDDNPIDDGLDDNDPEDYDVLDEPIIEENVEDYETYNKNVIDMKKHEENQLELMNEQLEMRKRVQVWHDNLRPILAEEEIRTAFDIHEYGTRVLNCFNSVGEQKLFEDLVGGLGQEEVARYFLSILMMTNTYNLKIMKSSDDEGEMIIELLKKERHHEELQVNIGNQVKK